MFCHFIACCFCQFDFLLETMIFSTKKSTKNYDSPDSLHSVGWTRARKMQIAKEGKPFVLESGATLSSVEVEYEVYGDLRVAQDNVILITHALSGDAHVAGWDSQTRNNGRVWRQNKPGWWDAVVGPGKAIDTERFCVICANVLGSCYGSTGPASINPENGKPWGLSFPAVTVGDWVEMEKALLIHLGVSQLYAVCGGSLGGQQALEWALRYPDWVGKCIILASGPKLPAQGLGFNMVARHAIMHDKDFADGNYYQSAAPSRGLEAARMLGHITYLSGKGMERKFGRARMARPATGTQFGAEFEVESYLRHQSKNFVERFDANSYLYITRAMDHYDAADAWGQGDLVKTCRRIKAEMMVVSFSSDWLYPPDECRVFVDAMLKAQLPVTYVELESASGHDAFLVDTVPVGRLLRAFLLAPSRKRQTAKSGAGGQS